MVGNRSKKLNQSLAILVLCATERACLLFGNTRIEEFEKGKEKLTKIQNDDNAAYKYLDFKDGASEIEFEIKQLKEGGAVSIHIDQPWGKQIAWINISKDRIGEWQTVSSKIEKTKGTHAVWLKFHGKENDIFELDWFRFN